MIRNLNAITFRDFGAVLSERPQNSKYIEKDAGTLLKLDSGSAVVYRAKAPTLISCGTAMIVLSVSTDGETFWHFCLDKYVSLRDGIYFAMTPFSGSAEVRFYTTEEPELIGSNPSARFQSDHQPSMDRKLRVEGIHTFFYQEKEQGFLFPGESHPMPELTYVDQGSLHSELPAAAPEGAWSAGP